MSFDRFARKKSALLSFSAVCIVCLCSLCADSTAQQTSPTRPRRVTQPQNGQTTNNNTSSPGSDAERTTDLNANRNATTRPSPLPDDAINDNGSATRNNETTGGIGVGSNVASNMRAGDANAVRRATNARRAYELLQAGQYTAARDEAKRVAAADDQNDDAWKYAGFAELNLKNYAEAARALARAYELQRGANQPDANTRDALAQSYLFTEQYERALPLLIEATDAAQQTPVASNADARTPRGGTNARRTTTTPTVRRRNDDAARLFYYRGIAEYRLNKKDEAARSFEHSTKFDPRYSLALYYLGRINLERENLDQAIISLNRATLADTKLAEAWSLLTVAYMRRAATRGATDKAKSDADYAAAVRAGETLYRLKPDDTNLTTYGQALVAAGLYTRAATVLETATAKRDADAATLYLLGVAQSRAKFYPKAVRTLERAATAQPDDVNIYRELGYALEVSKQYQKARAAYERGLQIAPDDQDFKDAIERLRPVTK